MKPIRVISQHASSFRLSQALLIYHGSYGSYITSHDVNPGKPPTLGAGRPLERVELEHLMKTAGRDIGMKGWVPTSLLYVAPAAIAWWRPAAPASAFFKGGAIDKKARQGTCPQPSLVFAVVGHRWFVWAVAGDARPTAETQLLQAPYYNIYDDGAICIGNVEVPKTLSPAAVEGFERAFFESRFTHSNAGELCDYEGGAAALWRDLLDGRHPKFPEQVLLPMKRTLGATMRSLAQETRDDDDL